MIITKEWVIEYYKQHGAKFIIPKDAEKIEENAFVEGLRGIDTGDGIEIYFEEGSCLNEIGNRAFSCYIKNGVTIPRTVRKIGDFAFYGSEWCILENGTEIEERRKSNMCSF